MDTYAARGYRCMDDDDSRDSSQIAHVNDSVSGGESVTIACCGCHRQFTFTADEQAHYKERKFVQPKHCVSCRKKRRDTTAGCSGDTAAKTDRVNRQMFPVTCALCKTKAEVPFRPDPDRPVYCTGCIRHVKRAKEDASWNESLWP